MSRPSELASHSDVSSLLRSIANGEDPSLERLMPLVYDELRKLAGRLLAGERPDHTLQPTALVHEAYLRLVQQRERNWRHQAIFYQVAAQMMRRVLLDHARARGRVKRGVEWQKISLDVISLVSEEKITEVLALDEALTRLAAAHPRAAKVVELRFFGGRSVEEAAEILAVSPKTVKRDFELGKAWLYGDLKQRYGMDAGSAGID